VVSFASKEYDSNCVQVKELHHKYSIREFCTHPYPNHPKGCPNFNKCDRCPPKFPYITDVLDVTKPVYFVYVTFDLRKHASEMKQKHPDWTDRQCKCVLYWQSRVRKNLKESIPFFMRKYDCNFVTMTPEGMGVNVYKSMRSSGIRLQRIKDLTKAYCIALIGIKVWL